MRHVQRSFVAGAEFVDIEEANRKLIDWVINEAGLRDHGTTHEAPMKRFTEMEASALLELPTEPFELVRVTQGTDHAPDLRTPYLARIMLVEVSNADKTVF